jgi:glycosyl transferase family 87
VIAPSEASLGVLRLAATAVLASMVTMLVVGASVAALSNRLAVDFRRVYMPAADAVLHGDSPYLVARGGYVYPPHLAFVLTPLTLLPNDVAAVLALAIVAALLVGTLAALGVRDPLCYLAVFVWAPTWQEFDMASVTAALVLAVALVWKHRDQTWRPAIALGLAVPAKLFLWPLLIWSSATRRVALAVRAIALGIGTTAVLWAALRFQGLADYPSMLRGINADEAGRGYSLVGIALSLGLGRVVGEILMLTVGAALLGACIAYARRRDDRRSFFLALASALCLTPVLWLHYFVFLMVPLAIARPRFSPIWLLPALLWIGPSPMNPAGHVAFLPALVAAIVFYRVVREPLQGIRSGRGAVVRGADSRPYEAAPTHAF